MLPIARTPEGKRFRRFTKGVTAGEVVGPFVPPVPSMGTYVIPSHVTLLLHLLQLRLRRSLRLLHLAGLPLHHVLLSAVDC